MIHEKKLSSLPQLMEEAENLDPDAGIRMEGRHNQKKCFVFITKSFTGFAVALYSMRTVSKLLVPDKRLSVQEFGDVTALEGFLARVAVKPVRAFEY